jgi:hypothetical protein
VTFEMAQKLVKYIWPGIPHPRIEAASGTFFIYGGTVGHVLTQSGCPCHRVCEERFMEAIFEFDMEEPT